MGLNEVSMALSNAQQNTAGRKDFTANSSNFVMIIVLTTIIIIVIIIVVVIVIRIFIVIVIVIIFVCYCYCHRHRHRRRRPHHHHHQHHHHHHHPFQTKYVPNKLHLTAVVPGSQLSVLRDCKKTNRYVWLKSG